MGLKTAAAYVESLRDGRVTYWDGERIDDITTHPRFRVPIEVASRDYDYADPRHGELRCFTTEEGGQAHRIFQVPRDEAAFEMALGRLLGAPDQASIALGGIVASTGLMIAMAVMVTSFRGAVDDWLESFLSADLYVAAASNEPLFDAETQRLLAATPGVAGIAFSKSLAVTLAPELPPALLIVRPVGGPGYSLPLIQRASEPGRGIALWFSEPAARLYGVQPGDAIVDRVLGRQDQDGKLGFARANVTQHLET